MRTLSLTLTALFVGLLAPIHAADPKKPAGKEEPKTIQTKLMEAKLKAAQKLLDGLATNDFDKITKSTDELLIISKTAEFLAVKTPRYEMYTNSFRQSLGEIAKKAKDKNLDGATLGYVDLTLTCVRCHQHTREERNASLPIPGRPVVGTGLGQ